MTKNEENKFSSYRVVISVLDENQSIISRLPALCSALTKLKSYYSDLSERDIDYTTSTSGKTNAKNLIKDELIDKLAPLTDTLFSFASHNNNEQLKAKCHVSRTKLKSMRASDLLSKSKIIHDLANANITELAEYGVTAARLTDLLNKTSEYNDALNIKDTGFTNKSAARLTLSQLFDSTDKILKDEIDPLIENFRETDKIFYDKYQAARVVKDLGLGHKEDPKRPEPPAQ